MTMISSALFCNVIINAILVGLIWIIQCVHYPSFGFIEKHRDNFHVFHVRSITPIVAPLMVFELLISVFLFHKNLNFFFGAMLLLVILIWLSTFLIQIPFHEKIKDEWNEKKINSLVRSNWIRTILWSLKLVILIWFYLGNHSNMT